MLIQVAGSSFVAKLLWHNFPKPSPKRLTLNLPMASWYLQDDSHCNSWMKQQRPKYSAELGMSASQTRG